MFDKLMGIMQGKQKRIGFKRVFGDRAFTIDAEYVRVTDIPVYEWAIRTNGESDLINALYQMIQKDERKENHENENRTTDPA